MSRWIFRIDLIVYRSRLVRLAVVAADNWQHRVGHFPVPVSRPPREEPVKTAVGILRLAENEPVGEENFFEIFGSFVGIRARIGRPGRVLKYSGLELALEHVVRRDHDLPGHKRRALSVAVHKETEGWKAEELKCLRTTVELQMET